MCSRYSINYAVEFIGRDDGKIVIIRTLSRGCPSVQIIYTRAELRNRRKILIIYVFLQNRWPPAPIQRCLISYRDVISM